MHACCLVQYLVFEYVEKTLLEVLEARRGGLGPEEVGWRRHPHTANATAMACCKGVLQRLP